MIVETMTHEEIVKEYARILGKHQERLMEKSDKIVRRYFCGKGGINKRKVNVLFRAFEQKIDNVSSLYVIPNCKDYKTYERLRPMPMFYLKFRMGRKTFYLTENISLFGEKEYNFYFQHLFDRYVERYLSLNEEGGIPLEYAVTHFFQHNPNIVRMECKMPNIPEKNYIAATDTGGIITGTEISRDIMEYKTYYGQEKLKNDQLLAALTSKFGMKSIKLATENLHFLLMKSPQELKQVQKSFDLLH